MNNIFCGKKFAPHDLKLIREIIENNQEKTRCSLSKEVCKALNWYKKDGGLKDMSCRVAMLKMHRKGLIELPAAKRKYYSAKCKIKATPQTNPGLPITKPVNELKALNIRNFKLI